MSYYFIIVTYSRCCFARASFDEQLKNIVFIFVPSVAPFSYFWPLAPHPLPRLKALYPPVSTALVNAFGSSSYALGPTEYELRSADLSGARRVLSAATQAMVGDEEGGVRVRGPETVVTGGCCRTALLQDPFEELVRRLASRVAAAIEVAVRSKGVQRMGGGDADTASALTSSGVGARTGAGFTEWGALLLRKEVRTLQQGLAALMETDSLNSEFADINELVRASAFVK